MSQWGGYNNNRVGSGYGYGYGAPAPPTYSTGGGYGYGGGHQYQMPPAAAASSRSQATTPPAHQPDRNTLWSFFQRVDRNRNGQIDARELQDALSNGTWMPFNPETVRLMITLFDRQHKGTVNFNEFCSLWKYVSDWRATFQRFDADNSGNIDKEELKRALKSFGYSLSDKMCQQLVSRFDRSRSKRLNFDDFIQLCVVLQTLTASFRNKDKNRRGVIRVSYEEYLSMVLRSGL